MASIVWLALAGIAILFIVTFVIILPVYTFILAVLTIIRQLKLQHTQTKHNDARGKHCNNSWDSISTSLFQGKVFHTRHQPMIHSFSYPLYFSVIDLDEASYMFGKENVYPQESHSVEQQTSSKGTLWPLSTLMMLRDIDHFKNGEGGLNFKAKVSMRLRISMLLYERTNGKMDLVEYNDDPSTRRRIVLVTHLMYYGYCFNPVSFFFVLKPNNCNNNSKTDKNDIEEEIEAIVVEVSNTPWNEMSIYVLHPDSDDVVEYNVSPPKKNNNDSTSSAADRFNTNTYRYKWKKNFHVSPFMTMDHDYDWKFQVSNDRIKVEANMIKQADIDTTTASVNGGDANKKKGKLYFTAGFDIHRTIQPTATYPLQLARIISRFPIYCFIIQVWIHYEAIRLLIKGVEFIPHPDGAETSASQAIAAVMRPVFAAKEWLCTVTSGGDEEKSKSD